MEDTQILSISPKSEELVARLVDKALNRLSYNLFFVDKKKNNLCMADVYVTFISRNDGRIFFKILDFKTFRFTANETTKSYWGV